MTADSRVGGLNRQRLFRCSSCAKPIEIADSAFAHCVVVSRRESSDAVADVLACSPLLTLLLLESMFAWILFHRRAQRFKSEEMRCRCMALQHQLQSNKCSSFIGLLRCTSCCCRRCLSTSALAQHMQARESTRRSTLGERNSHLDRPTNRPASRLSHFSC